MGLKTTETIEGKEVEITWQFVEIVERHDSNWCEWIVEGEDKEGNKYQGSAQADGSEPSDYCDSITEIEKL